VAGLFANDRSLAEKILGASEKTAEAVWELPLYKDYGERLKSDVADMKNTGGREGGAITAALFLERFAGKFPWAHLDIAGPAFSTKKDLCPMGVRFRSEASRGCPPVREAARRPRAGCLTVRMETLLESGPEDLFRHREGTTRVDGVSLSAARGHSGVVGESGCERRFFPCPVCAVCPLHRGRYAGGGRILFEDGISWKWTTNGCGTYGARKFP
jgi:hypothetical protein